MNRLRFAVCLIAGLIAAGSPCSHVWSAPPATSQPRTHSQGPLTADDFLGAPPKETRLLGGTLSAMAYTATDIHYTYRYRTERRERKWSAVLTEFDAFGVMLPDQSWNLRKGDRQLMDHEQGHLDLAEMWARRARAELLKAIARGEIRETGETAEAAVKSLRADTQRRARKFRDVLLEAHRSYDQVTRYGTLRDKQAEQRKQQARAIEALRSAKRTPTQSD